MDKDRLEAFSDGVLAIILTIMVAIGMQVVLFWVGYFNNIGNMLSQ